MEAHEGGYGTEGVRLQKDQMPLLLNEYGKHGLVRKKKIWNARNDVWFMYTVLQKIKKLLSY